MAIIALITALAVMAIIVRMDLIYYFASDVTSMNLTKVRPLVSIWRYIDTFQV